MAHQAPSCQKKKKKKHTRTTKGQKHGGWVFVARPIMTMTRPSFQQLHMGAFHRSKTWIRSIERSAASGNPKGSTVTG
jgi:hypothetical protein